MWPGFKSRRPRHMWVEFAGGFSPGTPVFPSPEKPTFPNSNSTRNQVDEEPLCGCATSKSLFIYLFIYFLTSSSPFLVLVTSICGCRVCRDNQCDWSQYSQHLRNISGSGSVPLAIVGSLYVSGKLPTYPSPIVLVWNDIRLFAPSPIALPPVGG